jgi:hypothetical protein
MAAAPLSHSGSDLGNVDRRRARVADQVHTLHAVQKREYARPWLRRSHPVVVKSVSLDQSSRPDARLFGPSAARFR